MSRHLTADEVRQDYIATMGKELGGQFNRLYNECLWLHLKWSEYVSLYGTSPARIDLLNKSARGFFVLLDSSLWEDVLLHICRLTDDPGVGRTADAHDPTGCRRSWILPSTTKSGGSFLLRSRRRSSRGSGATATSLIGISAWHSTKARNRSRPRAGSM